MAAPGNLLQVVNKFNRGEVDKRALARDDVEKITNSGEFFENWMPVRLGPMMYRPGTELVGSVPGKARFVPFVRSINEVAGLEFTDQQLRVWVGDAPVTRNDVGASVTNPEFTSDISGWTDDSGTGGSTSWGSNGYLVITGAGTSKGAFYQEVSTSDSGVSTTQLEHGLRLVVLDAPVVLKLGDSQGSAEYFEGTLLPGEHSLAFWPAFPSFFIYLENSSTVSTLIDKVEIETEGDMTLPCSVFETDLELMRSTQSADVSYFACAGYAPFQVERRGTKSWSLVDYRADDGPFDTINTTDIELTPGAISGNTTLTASRDYFTQNMVGQLFKLDSSGQVVQSDITSDSAGTNSIRVTGVSGSRQYTVSIQGTWDATVTLQRSADDLTWEDVKTYTSNAVENRNDGFDNSEFYYRLYIKTGEYTSGTVEATLTYSGGSITGICRVVQYNSATSVDIQILRDMGRTQATRDWYPGSWSAARGFPSAVALYEGRLWWAGKNKVWGSVSDAYTSFERIDDEGAASSIQRTIGFGPVDDVLWLAPSSRLLMGLASDEIAIRSSSFGEVLTQQNVNLKSGSSAGCAAVEPIVIDSVVYFVQRSKAKLHALEYQVNSDSHQSVDLMTLNQSIAEVGIKRVAVTREPETRIFVVLEDGNALVYLMDKAEDVAAWSRLSSPGGNFEDVYVLPSLDEDEVYFVVERDGSRYHERLAPFSESVGGSMSRNLDAHVTYSSPGTTLTGLDHLEGETVGVWGDGQFRGEHTVSSGQITVSDSWSDVCAGLRFDADWKSGKVKGYMETSVLTMRKRIIRLGLVMLDYWPGALRIGPDFSNLYPTENIEGRPTDQTIDTYDEVPANFDGLSEADPRIVLRADNPCTVMALVYHVKHPTGESE